MLKYLIPQILIIECSQDDWILDEDGIGGVDFLPRELADQIIDSGEIPSEIFEKCKAVGKEYTYEPVQEIVTEKDIQNLEWVSGDFHDAYIEECKLLDDGSLYVLFDGIWGCKIEIMQGKSPCISSPLKQRCKQPKHTLSDTKYHRSSTFVAVSNFLTNRKRIFKISSHIRNNLRFVHQDTIFKVQIKTPVI